MEVFVMTVKELAYTVQRHVQDVIGADFKRSHAYELLAAAYGFRTFASIQTEWVFSGPSLCERWPSDNESNVRSRCRDLGLSAAHAESIAHSLPKYLELNQFGITKISTLYAYLLQQFPEYSADSEDYEDEEDWQEALEDHELLLGEIAKSDLLYDEVSRAAEREVQYTPETLVLIRALRRSVDVQQTN
jgi:hypothetical protein